jgi:hypothetical protein
MHCLPCTLLLIGIGGTSVDGHEADGVCWMLRIVNGNPCARSWILGIKCSGTVGADSLLPPISR